MIFFHPCTELYISSYVIPPSSKLAATPETWQLQPNFGQGGLNLGFFFILKHASRAIICSICINHPTMVACKIIVAAKMVTTLQH
jgi:hypothetical protein